jgi:DNA-binding NarL/FixJ family response regulator
MAFRILIADDHAVVRDGLRMKIEEECDLEVVGEAENGREAVEMAKTLKPDVIIMDIAMPELNGIEATRQICEFLPTVRIIVLSMHNTKEHVFRAIQAGAMAYLLKGSTCLSIVKAVYSVIKGYQYFSDGVDVSWNACGAGSRFITKSPIESLSRRELQVLQFVVDGKTSAEIAGLLSLSPKSVETYRSRLMLKLGIENIPSLVKFALLHGITHNEI